MSAATKNLAAREGQSVMSSPDGGLGSLRQIQVRFDPEQDRLLLRVNTSSASELQCWLTRRMVRRLWPHLENALSASPKVAAQPTPQARETVKAFEREGAIQGSDLSQPYRDEVESRPLGDVPILVSKVNLRRVGDQHLLSMNPRDGQGFTLRVHDRVLHTVCELIRRAVAQAEWGLELGPAPAPRVEQPELRH